jgi:hypothetical protein
MPKKSEDSSRSINKMPKQIISQKLGIYAKKLGMGIEPI